jgi:ribonuclease G
VQVEIDKALKSKVAEVRRIDVNQIEAPVAIDVNTGRYVGKKSAAGSRTPSSRPIPAVKEIVRQVGCATRAASSCDSTIGGEEEC